MRKEYTLIALIFFSFTAIISCDKTPQAPYKTDSSGPINLVTVFSDQDTYALIEEGLRDSLVFGKTFPGLYYPPEVMFQTRHIDKDYLKRFNSTRLMLEVERGAPSIQLEKNKFAKPQGYVKVAGNSADDILQLLQKNQDTILNLYRWADRAFLLEGFKSREQQDKSPLTPLGVKMMIPNDYALVEKQNDFVWYRKDKFNTIQNRDERDGGIVTDQSQDILNILLFKVPFAKAELTQQEAYAIFDSITTLYTKGAKEPQEAYTVTENGTDSIKVLISDHIQIERNPILSDYYDYKKVYTSTHKDIYEAQGWWSMSLSQLGGPFTAKLILDKENKTLYVADAIMFAPLNQGVSKKRDYITAMESLFTTFKIKE